MKIGEIRDLLQAAEDQMLPDFIARFESDERSGVRQLVQRAQKRLDALEKERERLMAMHQYEEQYKDCQAICGIDEAGRGPLAGPVVAAAVILPKDCEILYLNDSKQLSAKKRELLYDEIMEKAVSVGVGYATPQRIDEINILQATYEAMRQAVNKLSVCPIVKGDAKSVSIAAASIIAKVTRDRLMMEYDKAMPQYHFAANKGYGSAEHIEALAVYGASPIHRRSFITHFKVKE